MFDLHDREWKEFFIGDLFEVKRPKPRSEKQYPHGEIPFVASGNTNNGVIKCCSAQCGESLDKGNCITVSPVDGSAFYQPCDFLGRGGAGSSILLLYNDCMKRHSGLFITRMIRQTCSKYCYGKMGNQESIKREKIMLPVDESGKPDYTFMERYIRERERQLVQSYISFAGNNGPTEEPGMLPLCQKRWKEFRICDIFTINPGKRLTKADMVSGQMPFVGATESNNGVTGFVSNSNASEDCNVLGVNYNGSVVESFYHPYPCIFSDDVKRFKLKHSKGNQYVYLFLKTVLLQQKNKYTYGYKFNESRMRKQSILLPVNDDEAPDYAYMEQYIREQAQRLLQNYISFNL